MKFKINEDDNPYVLLDADFLGSLTDDDQLDVVFLNCKKVPSGPQLEALEVIKHFREALHRMIVTESITYWNKIVRDQPNWFEEVKPLKNEFQLSSHLKIGRIYVHNDHKVNGYVTIGFSGCWSLDDEHGYGATFKIFGNSKEPECLEVGYQDVAFNDESEYYPYETQAEAEDGLKKAVRELDELELELKQKHNVLGAEVRIAYDIQSYRTAIEKLKFLITKLD